MAQDKEKKMALKFQPTGVLVCIPEK